MPRTTRASRAATAESDAATARAVSNNPDDPADDQSNATRADQHDEDNDNQGSDADQQDGANDDHDRDEGPSQRKQTTFNDPHISPQQSSFQPKNPDNYIKVLLATDNHVGYMERDPVRGQDSINTFREILDIAIDNDVDMILLGGDLFHENKPTRASLHQVIASIREKCLGDKPVSLELLSDPNDGRAEGYSFPAVNYEDSNLNVAVPIFSIHGNHDDPQGVGIDGALSALDLLSVSGLVNYFGKIELPSDDQSAGKSSKSAPGAGGLSDVGIRIRPVLLQKGDTKLALYGMGNIKDERMHFELRSNRVRMYRPTEDPDDWFNILCVHQNRAAHNPKACVPETMFDDSIHLVLWGHEHEQLIEPQAVGNKRYRITQPGSSVATSLSEGEAKEKQVAILHIENQDYFLEPIPLQTVRPFFMCHMALVEEAEAAGVNLDDKKAVQNLLKDRVYELIDRANDDYNARHGHLPPRQRPEKMLPLVRLCVQYDARYEMGNPIRFGQEFLDKVANPRDILSFSKRREQQKRKQKGPADERFAYVDVEADDDALTPDRFEKIKVGGLVQEFLKAQKLQILNGSGLDRAITNFVDKDDRDAIDHFVTGVMKSYQKTLNSMTPTERQLDEELEKIRDEQLRAQEGKGDEEEDLEAEVSARQNRRGTAQQQKRRQHDSDDSMLSDNGAGGAGFSDDDEDDGGSSRRSASPVKSRGGRGGARGGGRGRGGTSKSNTTTAARGRSTASSSRGKTFLGENNDDDEDEEADEIIDSDDAPAPKPTQSSSRADILSRKKTPARKPAAKKSAPAATPRAGGRAAAQKATRKMAATHNDDNDDEGSDGFEIDEEASQAATRSRRR